MVRCVVAVRQRCVIECGVDVAMLCRALMVRRLYCSGTLMLRRLRGHVFK